MTPTTPADNLRRALETIRDLPDDEVENGPEIADAALDAIDHLEALTTPADASPAAGEIVRASLVMDEVTRNLWLHHGMMSAMENNYSPGGHIDHLDIEAFRAGRLAVRAAIDKLDASRAETDAFRGKLAETIGKLMLAGKERDAANARAEALEREVTFLEEQEAGWLQVAADSTRRWQAAESKLSETAAELVRVREMLGKAAEAIVAADYLISALDAVTKGKVVRDLEEAWEGRKTAYNALPVTVLAEIEEGKSP